MTDDTMDPNEELAPAEEPEYLPEGSDEEAAALWQETDDDGVETGPNAEPVVEADAEFLTESETDGNYESTAEDSSSPPSDIWANAPQELREAHEAEMAQWRKQANDERVYAGRMRKKYEDLKASADREADKRRSNISDTLDEGLADYPEIAQPLRDALAPIEQQLEHFDRLEAARREDDAQSINEFVQSQQDILEQAHPGWEREFVNGPWAPYFLQWIKSPDRTMFQVKTVFETNRDHIFDAAAAIEVFDDFRADMQMDAATSPAYGQTQGLSARRAAQLEGSRSPRTPGGAPRVSGIPRDGDPATIWAALPDDNADDRLLRR